MKNFLPNKIRKPLTVLLALCFWICLWWLLAYRMGKPLLLPSPLAVVLKMFEFFQTKSFWMLLLTSVFRIICGIIAALILGVLLAFLTVKSRVLHALFSPILTVFKATPVASVIFLILLWIGRDRVPGFIAFIMALPIVWSNVRQGLLCMDASLLEMAQVFRIRRFEILRSIKLPSLLPYFLAACRSAIGISWKAGIAAEVLCTPKNAIGTAIYESKLYLLTDELFAYTLTVILISMLIEWSAVLLFKRTDRIRKEYRNHA